MSDSAGEPARRVQGAKTRARKVWRGWIAAFGTIVLLLVTTDALVVGLAGLQGLLIPSLAALSFYLFTRPSGSHASWRGAVIAPGIGAVVGALATLAEAVQPQFHVVLAAGGVTGIAVRRFARRVGKNVPDRLAAPILPHGAFHAQRRRGRAPEEPIQGPPRVLSGGAYRGWFVAVVTCQVITGTGF